ncbi:alpha/beta-Hydrolases superfamily protein [Actinidia rufa]|uniref:Alpha/beta-Hydrolases superfamily protein n=1 Tax=Actinidia rufa TaxID=165716 RepID=A0A7J0DFP6_9ERIC|nr:alpha/beta-Hydrolases superfamily protein [Actinidia rufa]
MLRLCNRYRRCISFSLRRSLSSSSSSSSHNSLDYPKEAIKNPQQVLPPPPSPPPILHHHPPPAFPLSRSSLIAFSATLVAAVAASYALLTNNTETEADKKLGQIYADVEHAIDRSNESFRRIVNRMKQTGVAAAVLWKSLRSVMSRPTTIGRRPTTRSAIVGAGGGAVLDWLLETVAVFGDNNGTQAEAARALAYLIADPNVAEAVLGRPHAVPYLLRFIFASQPQRLKKNSRRTSFDVSDSLKGRSMLVAALMDIITSNCDSLDKVLLKPSLPGNAEMRDIAAAIEVIEEGGMHLDEPHGSEEDDDGGTGMKGIGIKILGVPETFCLTKISDSSLTQQNVTSVVVPGLWDDLLCQHVAVPFAAWALANWAMASNENRSHIQELDQDGHAVMTALITAERSVKWHGSLVARFLLEDHSLPLNDSVPDWSFSLLSLPFLKQARVKTFLWQRSLCPHFWFQLREKLCSKEEALAKALESLSTGDMHMSLEESQKWSGVLVPWVFGNSSSDILQSSAIKILSRILEDYGPSSIPISQGWLALSLADILHYSKTKSNKGSPQPKTDKVKTQIDQANIVSAQQVVNQLADAVVNLAGNQLGTMINSGDTLTLEDLLNLEPFAGPFKNLKKDSLHKFDAADSALATLKGIKAITELCAEDAFFQNKIADFGILCLLRRFLLRDDYEQLAAAEAYDASRSQESQDRVSNVSGAPSAVDANDPSHVRVPAVAHIRRHAARLLTILSVLPKVQKVIIADEAWCKWLEECASGMIPGCNDVKIQSFARATLLNTFCNDQIVGNTSNKNVSDSNSQHPNRKCPRYAELIFLINPELPHWKCPEEALDTAGRRLTKNPNSVSDDSLSTHINETQSYSKSDVPSLDVVFVHGLRGGPFKTWRLSEDKSSTKSGLVEKIDEEAGKHGTFWPGEWLSADFPHARLFTLKYKTNLTQWSGATLPLQEVSSMILEKLVAAGIGNRPVVFVTHSMGGLVVKQMLHQAKSENKDDLVNNTVGVQTCRHALENGSCVSRPAPTIGELRSGSPRLVELNDFVHHLHKKGLLEVLSFCETKVTPIVEGYGGWAFRMEIVPIESAYPGFGELVVLESTDHVNSCKPLSRNDPSYAEIFRFLEEAESPAPIKMCSCPSAWGRSLGVLPMEMTTQLSLSTNSLSTQYNPPLQFPNFTAKSNFKWNRLKLIIRNRPRTISCCADSTTSKEPEHAVETEAATGNAPRVRKKQRRYRKLYPGEKIGITEEMRFVAMRLRNVNGKKFDSDEEDSGDVHDGDGSIAAVGDGGPGSGGETWKPSMEGFVKYLVDSKLVFDTVERIIDESNDVSYAYFRNTGLERSEGLSKDLKWFSQQVIVIPPPSDPGVTYVKYLEGLAEKSPPLFLSHYYNIYFSHIAGGQVIGKQVSEKLLEGRRLQFYRWEGNEEELLKGVREKLNMLGEVKA